MLPLLIRRGSDRKIEFRDAGSCPYQVVLRGGEPLRALRGDRTCRN